MIISMMPIQETQYEYVGAGCGEFGKAEEGEAGARGCSQSNASIMILMIIVFVVIVIIILFIVIIVVLVVDILVTCMITIMITIIIIIIIIIANGEGVSMSCVCWRTSRETVVEAARSFGRGAGFAVGLCWSSPVLWRIGIILHIHVCIYIYICIRIYVCICRESDRERERYRMSHVHV